MKRFYCITCKKVKRVQHWPSFITDVNAVSPIDRKGECNWHRGGITRTPRKVRADKPVKFNQPVMVTKSRKRA